MTVWLAVAVVVVVGLVTAVQALKRGSDTPVGRAVQRVSPDAEWGVIVEDRETGETVVSEKADEQFRSASLVKLLIAIDLQRRGRLSSTRQVQQVSRMLSYSDDKIASQLWAAGGGPKIVERTASALGLSDTEPSAEAGRWGDTLVTARDVLAVYDYVLELPSAQRKQLIEPLRDAPRRAADGFDQYFGIPSSVGGRSWAIKQGWAAGRGGTDAHTTGLVGAGDRYVIVLLTHHPEVTRLDTATESVTAGAEAIEPLLAGDSAGDDSDGDGV